jgi:hypothetical protein
MNRVNRTGWSCLTALLLTFGCASKKAQPGVEGNSPATPAPLSPKTAEQGLKKPVLNPVFSPVGRVSRVNTKSRFVVITYPNGIPAPVGERLNVYREQLKVGELRVTGPEQDNVTIADILAGELSPGDEVRAD